MWVIPSNLRPSLPFVPEFVDSKEDLSVLSEELESSLMWRSKPCSLKTWSARWNKVFWLPRLFGRTLKPSMQNLFETWLTESSADIHASRFPLQDKEVAPMTRDTFTLLFQELSRQQDLFGASSKTSQDISLLDTPKYRQIYDLWAMQLRQESTQRKKLALHTREKGSLSLQSEPTTWPTPNGAESGALTLTGKVKMWVTPIAQQGGTAREDFTPKLHQQVLNWTTPCATDSNREEQYQQGGTALSLQIKQWPTPNASSAKQGQNEFDGKRGQTLIGAARGQQRATPQARDSKNPDKEDSDNFKRKRELGYTIDLNSQMIQSENPPDTWPTPTVAEGNKIGNKANFGQLALSNHPAIVGYPQREKTTKGDSTGGQQDQENHNTNGKNLALNPAWVLQLMGITLEKTFFVAPATQLLNKQQK